MPRELRGPARSLIPKIAGGKSEEELRIFEERSNFY